MIYSTVYLAAEDIVGLAVGRRLIAEAKPLTVYREENGRGFGTLKKKVGNYQKMSTLGFPVLMLTDLDAYPCAAHLKHEWLKQDSTDDFLFRVCVREVEAWLLGDGVGVANLLRIRRSLVPTNPETLMDPKAELIRLAQKAPARIRKAITPIGTASIGPGYNEVLEPFIAENWSPEIAAGNCPSLHRTRRRIAELAGRVTSQ